MLGAFAATAGCTGTDRTAPGDPVPTVYVFNTGDRTLSVLDASANERIATTVLGTTASFPANQYGRPEADSGPRTLWLNAGGGVTGIDARSLEEVARIETGPGPNYPNATPSGATLIIAAGGTTTLDPDPANPPDHTLAKVDADETSGSFGTVIDEITVGYTGPCDVTLDPTGEYAYVPEIANERLAVIRIDPFEVIRRITVDPADEGNALPFMATAGTAGDVLLVENGEGKLGPGATRRGSESIWDISDPASPKELGRLTREDGLPAAPITSEVGPQGEVGYLFTPGGRSVTVIDVPSRRVTREIDIGGRALAGTWGPDRSQLYVPVQSANQVAVIDHPSRSLVTSIDVGEAPVGATAGTIRPSTDAAGAVRAAIASIGVDLDGAPPTTCPGQCRCDFGQFDAPENGGAISEYPQN